MPDESPETLAVACCPFCESGLTELVVLKTGSARVHCQSCEAEGPWRTKAEDAARVWNGVAHRSTTAPREVTVVLDYAPNPSGDDGGWELRAVFSSPELARKHVVQQGPNTWHHYTALACVIDQAVIQPLYEPRELFSLP